MTEVEQPLLADFVDPSAPAIQRLVECYGDNLESMSIDGQIYILRDAVIALEDGNWELSEDIQQLVYDMLGDVNTGIAYVHDDSINLLLGLVLTAFQDPNAPEYSLTDYCDCEFTQNLTSGYEDTMIGMEMQDHLWLINQLCYARMSWDELSHSDMVILQQVGKKIIETKQLTEKTLKEFCNYLACSIHYRYFEHESPFSSGYTSGIEMPGDVVRVN